MTGATDDLDDPDWAPQLSSIWDVEEDDDEVSSDDLEALPWLERPQRIDWHDPETWLRAERDLGRELLEAASAIARLDERLLRMETSRRNGLVERIALLITSDALWAEGTRLRPEHLVLADRDRIGRSEDEDQIIARATWAVRRQTRAFDIPITPDAARRFLGLHVHATERAGEDDGLWGGIDGYALQDWCGAQSVLADAHPLTQAAAGFHLWRGFALGAPERLCEPLMLAARIAASMARGGLISVPLRLASAGLAQGMDAKTRLQRWLLASGETTLGMQRLLDDLEAWRTRAEAATQDLNGQAPAALIRLFEARPVLSAKDCATALERTPAQTRQILKTFEERGLICEITGQQRFRFWTTAV